MTVCVRPSVVQDGFLVGGSDFLQAPLFSDDQTPGSCCFAFHLHFEVNVFTGELVVGLCYLQAEPG